MKGQLDPNIITLAFAFLFIGYGTKVGLVPLHNWLPDAHAEGPTPVSAVLSGLLLNVALYAVLRCKVLTDGALQSHLAGNLMMGFGLVSVVAAVFLLIRQKDVKRMFAYSSIEHMGLMTFAFGMGGPIANFAGLLHMTVHSLIKSAIFFAVGHAAQKAGTQVMDEIRGLIKVSPTVGLGPDAGLAGDPGHAAVRRLRQRVPDRHHRHARAALGHAVPAGGAGRGLRHGVQPGPADGVRRHQRQAAGASAGADPGVRAPGARPDAGPVHPALPGHVVPRRRRGCWGTDDDRSQD